MDALEALLTRRSIRRYEDRPVPQETVTEILKAGMAAPTAANEPWDFIVVNDRAALSEVGRFHPHAQMLKSAQLGIVVCADPHRGTLEGRWVLDCAACAENMLVAANALGLGACWVGVYPVEERIKGVRSLFGVPEHVIPVCIVSLGFPAEKKDPPNRFRPERIHLGRW
jgi:nitroreductase